MRISEFIKQLQDVYDEEGDMEIAIKIDDNDLGSETLVVRTDSQSWIRDIKCLKHANIDGREMVIID